MLHACRRAACVLDLARVPELDRLAHGREVEGSCGANAATFHAVAGERYAIRVGLDGSAADGVLRIRTEADDAFEPNQGCDQAVTLGTGVYQGMALDEDWFRALVPSSGELRVSVGYAPTDGTIEVFLHSSCDLAAITTPLKFSKGEELVWVNTGVNNTLIDLRLRPRDSVVPHIPYALSVNVTRNAFDDAFEPNDECAQPAPMASGLHTSLRSTSVDPDWYVVTVPRLGPMEFTLVPRTADHHLELFVYSPEISSVTGSCPGPTMWFGRPDARGNLVASFPERFGIRLYSLHVSSFVFTAAGISLACEPGDPRLEDRAPLLEILDSKRSAWIAARAWSSRPGTKPAPERLMRSGSPIIVDLPHRGGLRSRTC